MERLNSLLANSIHQAISLQTITETSISLLSHSPTRSTTWDSSCAKRIRLSLLELGSVRTRHRYINNELLISRTAAVSEFPANFFVSRREMHDNTRQCELSYAPTDKICSCAIWYSQWRIGGTFSLPEECATTFAKTQCGKKNMPELKYDSCYRVLLRTYTASY